MPFAAIATPPRLPGLLTVLAVASPFLFCFTQDPMSNFWPLLFSWGCAALLVLQALVSRHRSSVDLRWPSKRIAALHRLPIQLGMGKRCALRCAPMAARSLRHLIGDATLARRPAVATPEARPEAGSAWAIVAAGPLATGLLCAALLASVIGLLQYFLGDTHIPGLQPSTPGQAIGNLRQRNQQASLISMGLWALLWLLEHRFPAPMACRRVARWGCHGFGVAALALLAAASAATASRTGGLQWLLVLGACALWPGAQGCRGLARGWAPLALASYVLAAWAMPVVLLACCGAVTEGLFTRLIAAPTGCNSRSVLWSNMLHLIAQKPWTGWGWGELDYAHYVTLFPGERFCALLDNAHNLPLHLAVELGLPAALLLCGLVLAWVLRSRPWRERDPARQLAWGLLAIIGVHSMLEFPLWYGPFQLATLLAVMLLCPWPLPRRACASALRPGAALITAAAVALGAYMGRDYYRISQLYMPLAERDPALRHDTVRKVGATPFFTNQVDFALLTTLTPTRQNAGQVFAVANKLLHFSPEPRVIRPLIESAMLLGLDDEAAFHMQRYQAAFPADFARWQAPARRVTAPR
ncbi:Wzy polymerase domain-containing protein [Verminephrobacter eiseniae]|uniref:O-antigen polymerase n=2 Tax=Verminephrobacter eiseniae TaxID=364317 RepID=A1WJY5_VEREI|nr:Wzy polymerase domain-containing protein [Verminephrobacter eiseniae]ABM57942.1 O-antigen polymerase [Verminephrobacter eiseniae EF01-2]